MGIISSRTASSRNDLRLKSSTRTDTRPTASSAAKALGERYQVLGVQSLLRIAGNILLLGVPVRQRALYGGRPEPSGRGMGQVVLMRRNQHHLSWRDIKDLGDTQVGCRVGLVLSKTSADKMQSQGKAARLAMSACQPMLPIDRVHIV
jgi:hypothetical protein